MPTLNIFDDANGAFSLQSMTAAINQLPEVPTIVGSLGVFEEAGVTTTAISVEKRDESLTLVERSGRGGVGESVGGETRNMRNFNVPHFQRNDAVLADEVQNVRAFGTESTLETVQERVNFKMARHTRSFDLTLEHMRLGALSGTILDKDGLTIYNLFSEFGVTPPSTVDFVLGTSTTDVRSKCATVRDAIEDACEGEMVGRVYGLAGDTFFHKLVTHSKVEDTYKNWEASVALRNDPRLPFEFGGISWIRYHTKPKAKAANSASPLIGLTSCRFVAAGVPELYITRFAPADYEETVNTVGLPRYARQYAMPNGKGRHLEMQMNALCICTRPDALIPGTTSN
jgi:hypothetical protein